MTQPAVRRGGDGAKHVAAAMGCLPTCWSSEDAMQEQACRYDPHVHDMSSDPYTQVSLPALALPDCNPQLGKAVAHSPRDEQPGALRAEVEGVPAASCPFLALKTGTPLGSLTAG